MRKNRAVGNQSQQYLFQTSYVHNHGLFSNHWFENRLRLEPEWTELRDQASDILDQLAELWKQEKDRVENYQAEAPLEHAFIQPVFEILGWKLIYQTFLDGRQPDYALFLNDHAKDRAITAGRNSPEFWSHPEMVADAKAWHIPLDRPSIVNREREYPPQQIEWYLDRSRLDNGILTNGRLWRLVPRQYTPDQRRFQAYLECDLAGLLRNWRTARSITERDSLTEQCLHFLLFFSPAGYAEFQGLKPLVRRAIEGSSEYRVGVGEGLKERAFEALRLCIEGFLEFPDNRLLPAVDVEKCRQESFILLYRLLFIMYAEDRRLLPYRTNRTYTDNRSLGRHRDDIAGRLDRIHDGREEDFSREATHIWDDLHSLFDLVDSGHRRYGVPEYNGGLFDADAHPFLTEKQIADHYMARIIDQLGRAPDPTNPTAGLFRVDYRDLAIQHLGAVYEGLLELQPTYALQDMIVISRRRQGQLEEKYLALGDPVPSGWQLTDTRYRQGTIYLKTDKDERRASGSYYTPDHVVRYIIDRTIGQICEKLSDELRRELASEERKLADATPEARREHEAHINYLRESFDDRALRLRILDPAMGSGHFLLRACQKLAEEIATHPFTGEENATEIHEGESAVSYWKRRVVESCLYGVDMNGLAVELAKLALWLETVSADEPLSFLNHHLRHGNSLVGGRIADMSVLPGEIDLRSDRFNQQVDDKLTSLLEPLATIRELPSDTAAQIKKKDQLYRTFEQLREPFRIVGDLWCSAFCEESRISSAQYQQAIDELGRPRRFARLAKQEWVQKALALANAQFTRCFHWELEFPDAYFEGSSRRSSQGFDAVIGNPPYDVLSELETQRDLSSFRAFIERDPVYLPSRVGKNNLYKLFICRAMELLDDDGHLGFITPMAVLGDLTAVEIRRTLAQMGAFTGIEAFPQKDNPALRVFLEAKLSTAVITVVKSRSDYMRSRPFISRVHPAGWIDEDSPKLTMTTEGIGLYDPSNFTIVSCSQDDWDLATKMIRSGRLKRLGEFSQSFQGEVNETRDRNCGRISYDANAGPEVIRGAHVCLYVTREASQGTAVYLLRDTFLDRPHLSRDQKAFHHRHERVGFQRKSPQNNFRRLIAAPIPVGTFLLESVSYVPEHKCSIPLQIVLAILNSRLCEWYFRLGSTNAMVGEYQVKNLPCPEFANYNPKHDRLRRDLSRALHAKEFEEIDRELRPYLHEPPFSQIVSNVIVEAVDCIGAIERERGEISRRERSALDPAAQAYQDLIDRLLYAMAGLTAEEASALEGRLAEML